MNLTPEESAVLERLKKAHAGDHSDYWEQKHFLIADYATLVKATSRLFTVRKIGDTVIRWDDPVTPERLLACGWSCTHPRRYRMLQYTAEFYGQDVFWMEWKYAEVSPEYEPRNMLDIWTLMARAGVSIPGEVM